MAAYRQVRLHHHLNVAAKRYATAVRWARAGYGYRAIAKVHVDLAREALAEAKRIRNGGTI